MSGRFSDRERGLVRGSGQADVERPDAIPNAAGSEGGHGAATPDVATHTYSDSQTDAGSRLRSLTKLSAGLKDWLRRGKEGVIRRIRKRMSHWKVWAERHLDRAWPNGTLSSSMTA